MRILSKKRIKLSNKPNNYENKNFFQIGSSSVATWS